MVRRLFFRQEQNLQDGQEESSTTLYSSYSGKDVNSEVFVPDDSGLANGNIPSGTVDMELSYKTTLLLPGHRVRL